MTAVAYAYVGLFTATSMALIPWIVPSILIGVPIGAIIIQRMRVETFRRICMSFDAYVVAFGMSRLLDELRLVESPAAYLVLVAVAAIDSWLLLRFFSHSVDESTTRLSESGPLSTRDRGLVPTEDAAHLARQRDEGERLLKERQPVVTHAATHDRIIRVARHE
jgi:hypothetical protein